MAEVLEERLLLTFDELRILLFACGLREIEGIYMPEKTFSQGDIVKALRHMTEQGILRAEGEKFVIAERVQDILQAMKTPKKVFPWKPCEGMGPEFFCYVAGDRVTVAQLCPERVQTLRLQSFSEDGFQQWKELTECDYRGDSVADAGKEL